MTPHDFYRFRRQMTKAMGLEEMLSERQLSVILGCSRYKVRLWSEQGAPLYISYACRAIANGLTPWGKKDRPWSRLPKPPAKTGNQQETKT